MTGRMDGLMRLSRSHAERVHRIAWAFIDAKSEQFRPFEDPLRLNVRDFRWLRLDVLAIIRKRLFARHPDITRVVDISGTIEKKIDANLCNQAKGPGGHHGSELRAELACEGKKPPLLGDDDRTADRNYIREFVLAGNRALGHNYGVEYAETFHYIGPAHSPIEDYVKQHVVPLQ